MYNIYDALKSGQTADEIAKAFTDELNAAIQKQSAEEAAAKAMVTRKTDRANEIAALINDFMNDYYPGLMKDATIEGEDVITMLESRVELDNKLGKLAQTLFSAFDMENIAPSAKITVKAKTPNGVKSKSTEIKPEDVFASFFAKNNI